MAVLKRIHYNTPVVLTFFFLSLAALLLGALTGGWTTQAFFSVYRSPLTDPLGYVRLFGHVLGHAGYEHFASDKIRNPQTRKILETVGLRLKEEEKKTEGKEGKKTAL